MPNGAGGGGGGGIVGVGNSFTGPAEALELVGNHCYAYNNLGASTTAADVMSFTTGNYYTVGTLQVNMAMDYATTADNVSFLRAKLNGTLVAILTAGLSAADSQTTANQDLVIPPYTEVDIELKANGDNATRLITVGFTGRIYRTRD